MTLKDGMFGGAAVIRIDGRVDMSNADSLQETLVAAVSNAAKAVVVDMAGVEYISSAGLRALMIGSRAAKAAGKSFAIADLTPLVLEIFTISRFNLVFSLYPAVRDALEAVAPDSVVPFDAS